MTVPTNTSPAVPVTECTSCTVPTVGAGLCAFCQTYTPPDTAAQRLDVMVNKIDLLRRDGNEVYREIADTAPLLTVVDVITALAHLRRAVVALDRASDALEADTAAVTR